MNVASAHSVRQKKKDHQTNLFVVIQKAAESSSTESCW